MSNLCVCIWYRNIIFTCLRYILKCYSDGDASITLHKMRLCREEEKLSSLGTVGSIHKDHVRDAIGCSPLFSES